MPRRCQRFLLPPCQHNGHIQAGSAPTPETPLAIAVPPIAVAQIAARAREQLTPCPSAPAEASRNPAAQNRPCARSPPDAGAGTPGPLPPSIPPKPPSLPSNTKAGSLSHPLLPANLRRGDARGRSCRSRSLPSPPPLLPPPARCFSARGRRGGVGWSLEAAPFLSRTPSKTWEEISSLLKGALFLITGILEVGREKQGLVLPGSRSFQGVCFPPSSLVFSFISSGACSGCSVWGAGLV